MAHSIQQKSKRSFWKKFFPIVESLEDYNKNKFRGDLIAGLTVGVMLVPQGMAYAALAGMPEIYGLYAGVIPLILYAIFGTSRQLSLGPVAVDALLVLAGVSQLASPDLEPEKYIALVILAGFMVGVLQMLMSFARLGFLVNFLSHPVIAGFTSAAAIIILFSQLKNFLGMDIARSEGILDAPKYAIAHLNEINYLTLGIGSVSIIAMLFLKKINKSIPGPLLVVIIGTIICWMTQLQDHGVAIIETVPKGLPPFIFPVWDWNWMVALLPTVFTVTIISVVESVGIAKAIETRHDDYEIDANKELLALGASKIAGSFFSSSPTSASFTRSAVNDLSGARTNIASLITAGVIVLTLVLLTPLFYFLPKAILAAIVILSVRSLFEVKEAKHLWRTNKSDFAMMIITFITTLLVGIELGVATGLILSLLVVLYRTSRPHIAVLGCVPGKQVYRNIDRFDDAIEIKGALIIRFDQQLYFGNAGFFKDTIKRLIRKHPDRINQVFLDAKGISDIDSSGMKTLIEVNEMLKARNTEFIVCNSIGPVRDMLDQHNQDEPDRAILTSLFLHDAVEDVYK